MRILEEIGIAFMDDEALDMWAAAGAIVDRETQMEISDDTLALDMIAEVGPGGHHFGTSHTQARYQTEFYPQFLGDRQNYETWQLQGAADAAQRANKIWKDLLKSYEPPPMDEAIHEELNAFVDRRMIELDGVELYS
ncbi:MAG: trimethylamine methyltransferase family protein [Ardenticatenaceae bacterium]